MFIYKIAVEILNKICCGNNISNKYQNTQLNDKRGFLPFIKSQKVVGQLQVAVQPNIIHSNGRHKATTARIGTKASTSLRTQDLGSFDSSSLGIMLKSGLALKSMS